jgi:large subunit ribosomal protein L9
MRIILTKDMDALGLAGQIVRVSAGYARNKLLPENLAVEATAINLKRYEKTQAEFEVRSQKDKDRAQALAERIEERVLTISQKAGEQDKLYGSVTSMDLAEALTQQGIDVDRRKIRIADPIKSLGEYQVPIRLHNEVTATIRVLVVRAEE